MGGAESQQLYSSIAERVRKENDNDLFDGLFLEGVFPGVKCKIVSRSVRDKRLYYPSIGTTDDLALNSGKNTFQKQVDHLTKLFSTNSDFKEDIISDMTTECTYHFCWVSKANLICPTYTQLSGECWDVALSRGYGYYNQINKAGGQPLDHEQLLDGVSPKHLMNSGGIDNLENAREFMVNNGYVTDIVHKRPCEVEDFDDYETLIERLLARGPLVVSFNSFSSYNDYYGKDMYTPEVEELEAEKFENIGQHSVVVTGTGVTVYQGNVIEFWRYQDSWKLTGGSKEGFGGVRRRFGLIVAAVEFKDFAFRPNEI